MCMERRRRKHGKGQRPRDRQLRCGQVDTDQCRPRGEAVPGINIGAITLNAIIAGGIAAGMGEASSFIFEQISLGNRSVDDIDWIKKVLESELTSTVLRKLREVVEKTDGKMSAKDITGIITGVFLSKKKK